MPESQRSKCQESTGWPGGQIITRFGNQFWAKVKWLVATEEKARRPGGAQGAKMTRFWKVIKNKINCLGFPRAAEACQSENFVGEQGSNATLSVHNIGWWEDLQHILYFHTVQFWSKNWWFFRQVSKLWTPGKFLGTAVGTHLCFTELSKYNYLWWYATCWLACQWLWHQGKLMYA